MASIADDLANRVANGHGYQTHVVEEKQFLDLDLGDPVDVRTKAEYEEHVKNVVESKDTQCFTAFESKQTFRQSDVYYHPPSNTMVIDPKDRSHEPTAYRPENMQAAFDKKLTESQSIENRQIEVKHGIDELHPDLKQSFGSETKEPDKPLPEQGTQKSPDSDKPFREIIQATVETKAAEMGQRELKAATPVDDLASSYAQANPDAGATSEEMQEAAYFAHAVEDSDKYPPRDDEMRDRVEQRQFEEQAEKNYRKGSGEPPREENKQEVMQERMQSYMDYQKQYTM